MYLLFWVLLFLGSKNMVHAQEPDSSQIWIIQTDDRNRYQGTIADRSNGKIQFWTEEFGVVSIPIYLIRRVEKADSFFVKRGKIWSENRMAHRYFLSPSAFSLKKGERQFHNSMVLFNQLNMGLSDNFTLGIGLSPLFLGGSVTPFWITPQVTLPLRTKNFSLAIGGLGAGVIGLGESVVLAAFAKATFGGPNYNATFGLGRGSIVALDDAVTILMFASNLRLSKGFHLVTENYYAADNTRLVSLGGRVNFMAVALDFGLVSNLAFSGGPLIPLLSVTILFHSHKTRLFKR